MQGAVRFSEHKKAYGAAIPIWTPLEDFIGYPLSETVVKKSKEEAHSSNLI